MRKLGHAPGIIAAAVAGVAFAWAATAVAHGLHAPAPTPTVDASFQRMAAAAAPERAARLLSLPHFMGIAAHPTTVVLDIRPAEAFAQGHLEGAVNLPLSMISAPALAAIVDDTSRPVLIYGEENLSPPGAPLALSSHLFVTLQGFGYRNVFELNEAIDFNHRRVRWVTDDAAS